MNPLPVPFGKRLPGATYVFRPGPDDLPPELLETIRRAEIAANPDTSWNLLKIHTDQFAFTFLSYPEFDTAPHPALAEATKINLNTGTVVRTDYRKERTRQSCTAKKPFSHRTTRASLPSPLSPSAKKRQASTATLRESASGKKKRPAKAGRQTGDAVASGATSESKLGPDRTFNQNCLAPSRRFAWRYVPVESVAPEDFWESVRKCPTPIVYSTR